MPTDLQRDVNLMQQHDKSANELHERWANASEALLLKACSPHVNGVVKTSSSDGGGAAAAKKGKGGAAGGNKGKNSLKASPSAATLASTNAPLNKDFDAACVAELTRIRRLESDELSVLGEKVALSKQMRSYVESFLLRLEADIESFEKRELDKVPEDPLGLKEFRKQHRRFDDVDDDDSGSGSESGSGSGSESGSGSGEDEEMDDSDESNREEASNGESYCVCGGPSGGQMIGCDDDNCIKQWFHIECVGLKSVPKGDWVCQECLQRRANE
jgi:hypothetical protein